MIVSPLPMITISVNKSSKCFLIDKHLSLNCTAQKRNSYEMGGRSRTSSHSSITVSCVWICPTGLGNMKCTLLQFFAIYNAAIFCRELANLAVITF